MPAETGLDRRSFLQTAGFAGIGLLIGFRLPDNPHSIWTARAKTSVDFAPNAFLAVNTDESVTIWVHKSEMGQGVRTALPMLIAEELEVEWKRILVKQADLDERFGRQETGGSSSVSSSWQTLRTAGAAAREMLIAAAAEAWSVDAKTCRAERGAVVHPPTERQISYGQLAKAAARLPVPKNPPLKNPADFRVIGNRIPRIDGQAIVTGKAIYGFDVSASRMLYATIERPPVFGARLKRFESGRAEKIKGVRRVVPISSGVAVVADSTWAAFEGRAALEIEWEAGAHQNLSSAEIRENFLSLSEKPGVVAVSRGEPDAALINSARRFEVIYETAFLAHAPLETMNCVADVREKSCELWIPTQKPLEAREIAMRLTGLPSEAVKVHVTLLGGAFGRRLENDYVAEAVELSRAVKAPVQTVWTRADDMKHGFYRPATLHRLHAGLDKHGNLIAWKHRIVAPSVIMQRWEQLKPTLGDWIRADGLDETAIRGADQMPYDIPHVNLDFCMANTAVPTTWWRGTYDAPNAFAIESFIDEIAAASKRDAYQFRRRLLSKSPKLRAVLELAALKANWETPAPNGVFRGIAAHAYAGRVPVATIVEISIKKDGAIRINRVVSAADIGIVVNPSQAEAQVEGSIADGLASALKSEITVKNGSVEQSSYRDYQILRIGEMPPVEVHFAPSNDAPRGIGEPAVPPVTPALLNAIYAATKRRIRHLPSRAILFRR